MSYLSLYLKYRSQTFDEIIGQEAIVKTFKNAIKFNRLGHAYLFNGPRGTGKTSVARILAKALNCAEGPTPSPCNKCDNCVKTTQGQAVDVIEIDAASNRGIDEIRDLREKVRYAPIEGRYKVYIIDEVHMLTQEAFNALLKTIEEPPQYVIFILATTEVQRVPATILSRCQRFDFKRISLPQVKEHLQSIAKKEGFTVEDKALDVICRHTEGSMRDAISLLDQLISFSSEKITLEDVILILGTAPFEWLFSLAAAIQTRNTAEAMKLIDQAVVDGRSIKQIAKDLVDHFRYLLITKVGSAETLELTDEHAKQLKQQAESFSIENLRLVLRILGRADLDMKWHPHVRLVFEVAVLEAIDSMQQKEESKLQSEVETPKPKLSEILQPRKSIQTPEPKIEPKKELEVIEQVEKIIGMPKVEPLNNGDVIGQIRKRWLEILEKVRNKSLFAYVSLHEGEPLEMNGDKQLIIRYRKGYVFHKERLEEQKSKTAIEAVLEEIFSQRIVIKPIVSDSTEKVVSSPESVSLETVKEIFGGEIVT